MDKLGYCCINSGLRKQGIYCGRTVIKRKFTIEQASKLALLNSQDLLKILEWNRENGIFVYRISSDIFPRYTCCDCGYAIDDMADRDEIIRVLGECGVLAYSNKMQLSFHPGPFTVLGSPNPVSNASGIREVEYHSLLCDLLDPLNRLDIPINFHIGGSYGGTWELTAERFVESFYKLSEAARRRVCIENDDKQNGWSVKRIYDFVYSRVGVPITFDIHHWKFCHEEGREMQEDFELARKTWLSRSMQIHYSESRNPLKLDRAHSDYIVGALPSFIDIRGNYHIHLECKAKELALLEWRGNFLRDE